MAEFILTARAKDGSEAYISLDRCGLRVSVEPGEGAGEVLIHIIADAAFEGVIRIAMPLHMQCPRFFLPGFIYGANRGEAPLVADSNCPRLRAEDGFPASPWWMTRSDRLSHPCALAWGDGRLAGLSASPYYLRIGGRQVA